jgi:hypothetical protein
MSVRKTPNNTAKKDIKKKDEYNDNGSREKKCNDASARVCPFMCTVFKEQPERTGWIVFRAGIVAAVRVP